MGVARVLRIEMVMGMLIFASYVDEVMENSQRGEWSIEAINRMFTRRNGTIKNERTWAVVEC